MPSHRLSKCFQCKRYCWSRQRLLNCFLCNSIVHAKCLHFRFRSEHMNTFFCQSCVGDILPFHTVKDNEFQSLFRDTVHDIINNFNVLDDNLLDYGCVEENNISVCKYYYPYELRKLHVNGNLNRELSMIHVNIRSIKRNFYKLENLLSKFIYPPQIIGLSETNIQDENKKQDEKKKQEKQDKFIPTLKGYDFFSDDSRLRVGGSGIFIKSDLDYTVRNDLYLKVKDCENVWLEICTQNKKIIVSSLYRHPRHNFSEYQEAILNTIEKINSKKQLFYILGDMNLNLLKYSESKNIQYYLDQLQTVNCHNIIDKPTRVTMSSFSLIDHIYTNDLIHKLTPSIILSDISDHFPTFLSINTPVFETPKEVKFRDMKHFVPGRFLYELKESIASISEKVLKFETGNQSDYKTAVDNAFSDFHHSFFDLVNEHAPYKTISPTRHKFKEKPWISRRILDLGKKRDKLYSQALKTRDSDLFDQYKQIRNKVNHETKLSEKHFYRNKIQAAKNKSKVMWQLINGALHTTKKKSKSNISRVKILEKNKPPKYLNDPNDIANAFNEFFVNIGKSMADKIPNVDSVNYSARLLQSFALQEVVVDEIANLIYALSDNKSCREDDIPVKFLKLSCSVIAPFLTNIFNKCITLGIYPDLLKTAKVIPLFKEGQKDECSNYRPISLLMHANKIFEKLIHKRLYSFLQKMNILDKNQYGFRKKHSTAYAIYDLIENKLKNLDDDLITCALYIDLSKAFDTVDHNILMSKLENYGIRGTPLDLLKNYLSNRKQFTVVNGQKSGELPIEIGVPQGSVLGPLLFLLYINDLPYASLLLTKLYADDTCLIFSAKTVDELQVVINREVNKIQSWMFSNKLSINYKKTKFMIINKRNNHAPFRLYINDNRIEQVKCFKYLGIRIDDKLEWKEQIKYIEGKISSACGAICRLRQTIDTRFLRTFYFAHAYFHLQYSTLAWYNTTKRNLKKLNSLHGKLIRLMTLHGPLRDFNFSADEMFKNLNLLRLDDIYKLELAKFMHRAVNKNLPQNFEFHFTRINEMHPYNLRSIRKQAFYSKLTKTAKYRNWITNSGISLWKDIPSNVKDLSYKSFAKKYKTMIVDSY